MMIARRFVYSPFGWSVRAVAENPLRTQAIGIPTTRRLVVVYTLAAAIAGIAGALLAQTTQFVSLDVLAFHRSADLLLILIIGGTGYLYGGLIGALLFKIVQNFLSNLTPEYWEFWIGLILIAIVLTGRERITSAPATLLRRLRGAA
jgi:branched-chain amino acid transport system permease protein